MSAIERAGVERDDILVLTCVQVSSVIRSPALRAILDLFTVACAAGGVWRVSREQCHTTAHNQPL